MGRLLPLLLGVFSTLHILGVSAQTAPACIETCTNEVRNKFADLKCSDANAAPCFCANPTFSSAILECSKPQCGGTPESVFKYLSASFCVGQPLANPDSTAAPSSAASQTPTPSVHATATSTPAAAAETSPAASSSTTATPAATTSMSAESTTPATAVTTGASTKSSSPSSTSDSAATEGSSSKGLSQAAIAGIGVGIGAAVIAIVGIVICMLLKARRRKSVAMALIETFQSLFLDLTGRMVSVTPTLDAIGTTQWKNSAMILK